MARVEAPAGAFDGVVAGVTFKEGVASTDDANALAYFRRHGYTVDGELTSTVEETQIDSRDVGFLGSGIEPQGTRLRDASIDPEPEDFLPPINAGEADPHGPLVVAPGLHGVPPAPIAPGDVHVDDPAVQQAKESELARAVLVDGQDVGEAVAVEVPDVDDRGPLGLSDPGSVDQGVEEAEAARPNKTASKPEWVAFAVSQGMSEPEAKKLTKPQLIDRFGGE
jgi:hypothetical protein